MAKGSLIAVMALGLSASACTAADFTLRGVTLGAPPPAQQCGDALLATSPCFKPFDPDAMRFGWLPSVIGGMPKLEGVAGAIGVVVTDGKVEQVELYFAPHAYPMMLEALTQKFGQPLSAESRQFQTALGRVVVGKSARWDIDGGGAYLELDEHRSGSDRWGYATLTSRRHLDSLARSRTGTVKQLREGL